MSVSIEKTAVSATSVIGLTGVSGGLVPTCDGSSTANLNGCTMFKATLSEVKAGVGFNFQFTRGGANDATNQWFSPRIGGVPVTWDADPDAPTSLQRTGTETLPSNYASADTRVTTGGIENLYTYGSAGVSFERTGGPLTGFPATVPSYSAPQGTGSLTMRFANCPQALASCTGCPADFTGTPVRDGTFEVCATGFTAEGAEQFGSTCVTIRVWIVPDTVLTKSVGIMAEAVAGAKLPGAELDSCGSNPTPLAFTFAGYYTLPSTARTVSIVTPSTAGSAWSCALVGTVGTHSTDRFVVYDTPMQYNIAITGQLLVQTGSSATYSSLPVSNGVPIGQSAVLSASLTHSINAGILTVSFTGLTDGVGSLAAPVQAAFSGSNLDDSTEVVSSATSANGYYFSALAETFPNWALKDPIVYDEECPKKRYLSSSDLSYRSFKKTPAEGWSFSSSADAPAVGLPFPLQTAVEDASNARAWTFNRTLVTVTKASWSGCNNGGTMSVLKMVASSATDVIKTVNSSLVNWVAADISGTNTGAVYTQGGVATPWVSFSAPCEACSVELQLCYTWATDVASCLDTTTVATTASDMQATSPGFGQRKITTKEFSVLYPAPSALQVYSQTLPTGTTPLGAAAAAAHAVAGGGLAAVGELFEVYLEAIQLFGSGRTDNSRWAMRASSGSINVLVTSVWSPTTAEQVDARSMRYGNGAFINTALATDTRAGCDVTGTELRSMETAMPTHQWVQTTGEKVSFYFTRTCSRCAVQLSYQISGRTPSSMMLRSYVEGTASSLPVVGGVLTFRVATCPKSWILAGRAAPVRKQKPFSISAWSVDANGIASWYNAAATHEVTAHPYGTENGGGGELVPSSPPSGASSTKFFGRSLVDGTSTIRAHWTRSCYRCKVSLTAGRQLNTSMTVLTDPTRLVAVPSPRTAAHRQPTQMFSTAASVGEWRYEMYAADELGDRSYFVGGPTPLAFQPYYIASHMMQTRTVSFSQPTATEATPMAIKGATGGVQAIDGAAVVTVTNGTTMANGIPYDAYEQPGVTVFTVSGRPAVNVAVDFGVESFSLTGTGEWGSKTSPVVDFSVPATHLLVENTADANHPCSTTKMGQSCSFSVYAVGQYPGQTDNAFYLSTADLGVSPVTATTTCIGCTSSVISVTQSATFTRGVATFTAAMNGFDADRTPAPNQCTSWTLAAAGEAAGVDASWCIANCYVGGALNTLCDTNNQAPYCTCAGGVTTDVCVCTTALAAPAGLLASATTQYADFSWTKGSLVKYAWTASSTFVPAGGLSGGASATGFAVGNRSVRLRLTAYDTDLAITGIGSALNGGAVFPGGQAADTTLWVDSAAMSPPECFKCLDFTPGTTQCILSQVANADAVEMRGYFDPAQTSCTILPAALPTLATTVAGETTAPASQLVVTIQTPVRIEVVPQTRVAGGTSQTVSFSGLTETTPAGDPAGLLGVGAGLEIKIVDANGDVCTGDYSTTVGFKFRAQGGTYSAATNPFGITASAGTVNFPINLAASTRVSASAHSGFYYQVTATYVPATIQTLLNLPATATADVGPIYLVQRATKLRVQVRLGGSGEWITLTHEGASTAALELGGSSRVNWMWGQPVDIKIEAVNDNNQVVVNADEQGSAATVLFRTADTPCITGDRAVDSVSGALPLWSSCVRWGTQTGSCMRTSFDALPGCPSLGWLGSPTVGGTAQRIEEVTLAAGTATVYETLYDGNKDGVIRFTVTSSDLLPNDVQYKYLGEINLQRMRHLNIEPPSALLPVSCRTLTTVTPNVDECTLPCATRNAAGVCQIEKPTYTSAADGMQILIAIGDVGNFRVRGDSGTIVRAQGKCASGEAAQIGMVTGTTVDQLVQPEGIASAGLVNISGIGFTRACAEMRLEFYAEPGPLDKFGTARDVLRMQTELFTVFTPAGVTDPPTQPPKPPMECGLSLLSTPPLPLFQAIEQAKSAIASMGNTAVKDAMTRLLTRMCVCVQQIAVNFFCARPNGRGKLDCDYTNTCADGGFCQSQGGSAGQAQHFEHRAAHLLQTGGSEGVTMAVQLEFTVVVDDSANNIPTENFQQNIASTIKDDVSSSNSILKSDGGTAFTEVSAASVDSSFTFALAPTPAPTQVVTTENGSVIIIYPDTPQPTPAPTPGPPVLPTPTPETLIPQPATPQPGTGTGTPTQAPLGENETKGPTSPPQVPDTSPPTSPATVGPTAGGPAPVDASDGSRAMATAAAALLSLLLLLVL
eukprot:TRINITY_DN2190_c0_g4_i1.p1 TRINITY_DN2190_c0_g4~~TRINITY_DN2190_c0_g4_i1.p1  ORF type:complete len:2410 (+),score=978.41 TRINITY_DN2190_c0_g4_i1:537-7232(+)